MATPPAASAPAPAASSKSRLLVIVLVCALCTAGGAGVPWVLKASPFGSKEPAAGHAKAAREDKTVAVTFGEVVVNLHEERMSRYLRLKILLAVDADQEKAVNDQLNKAKAPLKSWLISHLSGKSLKDVGGSVGVKRLQREILEHFEEALYPDGGGPLREVLFEEYVVQ